VPDDGEGDVANVDPARRDALLDAAVGVPVEDEIRAAAVDVAMAAARRIIAESFDAPRGARLIDDAIQGLPQRLH
jgi:hypothetical protein